MKKGNTYIKLEYENKVNNLCKSCNVDRKHVCYINDFKFLVRESNS